MINKLLKFFQEDVEEKNMIKFIDSLPLQPDSGILDVGCGYGRNINLIKEKSSYQGLIDGVDINPHIVQTNRQNGLICYTVEEFKQVDKKYDCLIFSHIVEHFMPNDLKAFMDFYLDKLKDGGYVIIATPVLWQGFYWDFDHIKMYHPIGMDAVFGGHVSQVQYYAQNVLSLQDIWFRKSPYVVDSKRGLYIQDNLSNIWSFLNIIYRILFKLSFGLLGKTTGWMGLYRKNLIKSILIDAKLCEAAKSSVAIWGMGVTAVKLIEELKHLEGFGMDVVAGFFNGADLNLIGQQYNGYEVLDFRKLNEYNIETIIIAAIDFEEEIYQQIKKIDKSNSIKIIKLS